MTAIRLQPLTRARVSGLGPVGQQWLEALPGVLDQLATQWSLQIGRALPGGSASYVVGATTADGRSVVAKVALPDPGLDAQVATLERAAGRGYVQLLAYDAARGALLLERLGASLDRTVRRPEDQLRILADTLTTAWLPATSGPVDKAADLKSGLLDAWQRLGRPCSRRVVDQAAAYADRRSADPGEPVVVHGDPHPGNLLAVPQPRPGGETGFCFVDPDGFVADRAYDLGVALRDWCSRLQGADARRVLEGYGQILAERTGVDTVRIWEWGFVERVSTGLYVLDTVGSTAVGRPFLDTAERLLD